MADSIGLAPADEQDLVGIPNHVVVTNIQMPFLSMVWFMVKWSIAAIPAAIILFFLLAILFGVFGAFVGLGPDTLVS